MKAPFLASIFSQQASPWLWLLAQKTIGGTPDKQSILRQNYKSEKRVVEVGCSIGNIARSLINEPDLEYLGLDIDNGALDFARKWFAPYPNFSFSNQSLQQVAATGARFDLVCVTGVLHHVPDDVAQDLLNGARAVAAAGARLLMFDPIPLRPGDGPVYGIIHKLEQGEFLRSPERLSHMITEAGFVLDQEADVAIGPGLVPWPKIVSLSVMTAHAGQ